jgi:hypothetical protein
VTRLGQCLLFLSARLSWRGEAYLGNVVVQPFGTQCAISTSIVPIVVPRHVFEHIVHSLRRDMREERLNKALVPQVGEICNSVNKSTLTGLRRLSLALPDKMPTCWA